MDLTQLDGRVQYFCAKGVAESTQKTYQSAIRKFHNFCSLYNIVSPFPVSESMLCYFTTYLAGQNLCPQTIKTYLAGIRHMQVTLGLPEPRAYSSLPRLRLVQTGVARTHRDRQVQPTRVRLPITAAILRRMKKQWGEGIGDFNITMLWAASVLCYFGFFRAGELTVPSVGAYREGKHLSWGDVAIDDPAKPATIRVLLRHSKTDQLGKGVEVFIGMTGDDICPVAAVASYMVARGNKKGPFFVTKDGKPLTKPRFTQEVREVLRKSGLSHQSFAGHSFRIGAATAAAAAGIEDSTIRILGRWSSSAFLAYIRTPRGQLAHLSKSLS